MADPKGPALVVTAVFAACAMATPLIAKFEGYRPAGYHDPAPGAFETICYGHKQTGASAKTLTDAQCGQLLAQDAVSHGMDISACIPLDTPISTRAAFTSFAFNVGSAKFCSSGIAIKARAHDWRGACAGLSQWIYAGGKVLPGLPPRRAAERQLCEQDL